MARDRSWGYGGAVASSGSTITEGKVIPATVLEALRSATTSSHDRLSVALSPEELCADRDRYTRFLAALYGFHAAAEQALATVPQVIAPVVASRSGLIASDLRALGNAGDAPPVMPWTVPLDRPGAAWGVVYVVEGSALGGMLLAKLARHQLGLDASNGAGFFASGAAAGTRWRAVKAELAAPVHVPWAAAATAAAAATFAALDAWMAAQGMLDA